MRTTGDERCRPVRVYDPTIDGVRQAWNRGRRWRAHGPPVVLTAEHGGGQTGRRTGPRMGAVARPCFGIVLRSVNSHDGDGISLNRKDPGSDGQRFAPRERIVH